MSAAKVMYQLSPEVCAVLREIRWDQTRAYIERQLDRKLYTEVNKVLEAFGGVWKRSQKGHLFDSEDAAIAVAEAAETGAYIDLKKAYQFFETPPSVVTQLLRLAGLQDQDRGNDQPTVLEPSAGHGAIATGLRAAGCLVSCVEIDPVKCDKLRAAGFEPVCADFLTMASPAESAAAVAYDAVVMNPPFSGGQDMQHVRRAYEWLRPGGVLVAVMSPRLTYGTFQRDVEFRAWLAAVDRQAELGGEPTHQLTHLPAGVFRASGTDVRTVVLAVRRPLHVLAEADA